MFQPCIFVMYCHIIKWTANTIIPSLIYPVVTVFNWKKRPLNRTTLHVTENFGQDQDAVDLMLI